jgi:hypothetical protein
MTDEEEALLIKRVNEFSREQVNPVIDSHLETVMGHVDDLSGKVAYDWPGIAALSSELREIAVVMVFSHIVSAICQSMMGVIFAKHKVFGVAVAFVAKDLIHFFNAEYGPGRLIIAYEPDEGPDVTPVTVH